MLSFPFPARLGPANELVIDFTKLSLTRTRVFCVLLQEFVFLTQFYPTTDSSERFLSKHDGCNDMLHLVHYSPSPVSIVPFMDYPFDIVNIYFTPINSKIEIPLLFAVIGLVPSLATIL